MQTIFSEIVNWGKMNLQMANHSFKIHKQNLLSRKPAPLKITDLKYKSHWLLLLLYLQSTNSLKVDKMLHKVKILANQMPCKKAPNNSMNLKKQNKSNQIFLSRKITRAWRLVNCTSFGPRAFLSVTTQMACTSCFQNLYRTRNSPSAKYAPKQTWSSLWTEDQALYLQLVLTHLINANTHTLSQRVFKESLCYRWCLPVISVGQRSFTLNLIFVF